MTGVLDKTIALDLRYLRALGVAHQLEDWRRITHEIAAGSGAPARLAARA
ncbi:MAG TPA: hypothetical protein VHV51_01450 [Polyangiaceae bacterium]|nr:hypothetical protein [Polyangiaceae bacterium]